LGAYPLWMTFPSAYKGVPRLSSQRDEIYLNQGGYNSNWLMPGDKAPFVGKVRFGMAARPPGEENLAFFHPLIIILKLIWQFKNCFDVFCPLPSWSCIGRLVSLLFKSAICKARC